MAAQEKGGIHTEANPNAGLILPRYRKNELIQAKHIRDGPGYLDMAQAILAKPNCAREYSAALQELLEPLAETTGELSYEPTKGLYFSYHGKAVTDFGVILLYTIQIHYEDRIEYEFFLLVLSNQMPARKVRIKTSEVGSRKWLDDLGPQYIYENGALGRLETIVKYMSKFAPIENEYHYNGWAMDKADYYIWDGEKFSAKDWSAEKTKAACSHALDMLDVAPHPLTLPLLAIALLSLVHSKMMELGTFFKGVCCIEAPTQSFKTTLAALFFDFEHGREADTNFEATMAAIVRTIGNTRDTTAIVDDYKPGATKVESRELVKKLSTIIRMCSDDSGGVQKAGRENSTVSNRAQGLVLVTAEHVQLSVQSSVARLLILELDRKGVDVEKLTLLQNHHSQYKEFLQSFIRYVASQGVTAFCKKLTENFLRERNTLRAQLPAKEIPVDNRTSDMCTWLWLSFTEFLGYAQKTGALSQPEYDSYEKETRSVFLTIMERQAERVADLDCIRLFFRGLQVLLETKEATLAVLQPRNNDYASDSNENVIGFQKKDFVFLKNGVALQRVVSYYHRLGHDFIVSETTLRKYLADIGAIVPSSDGKTYIYRLSVNHRSYQTIKIKKEKFYDLLRVKYNEGTEEEKGFYSDVAGYLNAENILGRDK